MKRRQLGWAIALGMAGAIALAFALPSLVSQIPNPPQSTNQDTSGRVAETSGLEGQPQSGDQILQQVKPAVVTIYSQQEVGSGSLVNPTGLVLTSRHVLQDSRFVTVKTSTGATYSAQVIDLDLQYDLALLRLEAKSVRFPIVTFADRLDLQPGKVVYAIGSPANQPGILTVGSFTRFTQHGSLQLSPGLLVPGNSGGPLLNQEGEVIGINKGLLEDNSGLATPVAPARAMIAKHSGKL
jgi:S1-C subfamily serine protease